MNNLQQAKEFRTLCKCVLTENQKTVMFNAIKALKAKIEAETNGWAGEISKIERKKRYSLSICEKEMCKWTLSFGWKDEHSFSRHNFHAEKIVEYNKKIKYLKDCQEAIKICEEILK